MAGWGGAFSRKRGATEGCDLHDWRLGIAAGIVRAACRPAIAHNGTPQQIADGSKISTLMRTCHGARPSTTCGDIPRELKRTLEKILDGSLVERGYAGSPSLTRQPSANCARSARRTKETSGGETMRAWLRGEGGGGYENSTFGLTAVTGASVFAQAPTPTDRTRRQYRRGN